MSAPVITVSVGPRNAYTDKDSGLRFYRWQGRDLPSVTTIRRMAGLPHGLHQWSLSRVIDKALDNLPAYVARLESQDPGQLALIRHELRGAATAERDAAAKLGTAVHDAAATGLTLSDVPPEIAPRLRQYWDWLDTSGVEILAAEFQLFNLTLGYAGTADLLGRLRDGSIWVIDLKTGKGLYSEHVLQLMAYLMGEFVGLDDTIIKEHTQLLHQAKGIAVLHLTDDHWEFRSFRPDQMRRAWSAFRGLLSFSTWAHEFDDITALTASVRDNRDRQR